MFALLATVAAGGAYAAARVGPVWAAVAAAVPVGAAALVRRRAPLPPRPVRQFPPDGPTTDTLPRWSDSRTRLLESALIHAHDAVAILDARSGASGKPGRAVMYVNDALCTLTGYSREELLGRSLHLLGGNDSDPVALSKLRTALDTGVPVRLELRNYRKDGVPYWVELSAIPVPGTTGGVSHWLILQRDIDRRKTAERRAKHTSQLLRAIIDAFPGPISAKDRDGRYLVMNQYQADLLNIAPDEAVGRTATELTDAEHGKRTSARDREVIATAQPVQFETEYPGPGGVKHPWLTSKAPLWMPDGIDSEPGGARGVVTVAVDISALKIAQDALRRSEKRYRQLYRAIPNPVFAYDAQTYQILSVNEATVRKYGYSRDEFLRMTMHDIRPADDTPSPFHALGDTGLPDGPPAARRHVTRDGTILDVDVNTFTLNLDGRAVRLALVTDVTARRQAEVELRRSEGLFRGMFENASAGVSLTDPNGRFVACNPAFATMVGRSVDELLELTPADVTHPDDWATQAPLLADVRAGRRDRFTLSKRYVRPDGEIVWTELSFAAVRTQTGAYEYGLGVSLNVTERKQLEDQLRQAQRMDAVGQMAGGVAHDFNNLLTAVLGNLDLVELPEGDPNRALLAVAEQAAIRAAELTRQLLGYARRNQLVFAAVPSGAVFDEVLALLRATLDPRILLDVAPTGHCPLLWADHGLLTQAVLNLCLNARDAMPRGGALALSAEPVVRRASDAYPPGWDDFAPGAYVRLTVADTGTGMTPDVLARLFEPFFTTKGVGKGTGLGLPMVQGIVKQHRGWIEIHTELGAGTRFDLYIPVADVTAAVDATPIPNAPTAIDPVPAPRSTVRTRTVLLVDDESMVRDLGRAILTRAGYRVLTAEDGVEAVETFERQRAEIDLVVLDVTMPRMSGRDALRHILDIDPAARVLFSTGFSAEDLASVDGAIGLLSKPYRPQDLVTAVRAALAPQPVA